MIVATDNLSKEYDGFNSTISRGFLFVILLYLSMNILLTYLLLL